MTKKLKISGLMSVHEETDADHLRACLVSIFQQTRPLDELVTVFDGPVDKTVEIAIAKYGKNLSIVRSPVNMGLGAALNMGLEKCKHPLAARFDSDDIYPPDRLKLQAGYLESHEDIHILGGQIEEFENSPGDLNQKRQVPELVRPNFFTVRRNPINHMTVMFRTENLRDIGNYSHMRLMQDYELWLRAMSCELKIANLPNTLAYARIGGEGELYERRRGLKNIRAEMMVFMAKMRLFKFYWLPVLVLSLTGRIVARLLPAHALKTVYRLMLRK